MNCSSIGSQSSRRLSEDLAGAFPKRGVVLVYSRADDIVVVCCMLYVFCFVLCVGFGVILQNRFEIFMLSFSRVVVGRLFVSRLSSPTWTQ